MRKYIIRSIHFLNVISLSLLYLSGCASDKKKVYLEKPVPVWDTVESPADVKKRILDPDFSQVHSMDISPDGKYLVAGSFLGKIKIWDVETGVEKLSLDRFLGHGIRKVAFNPDGRSFVAVGYNSGTYHQKVKLCDLETGSEKIKLDNSKDFCKSAAFSSDGKYLVGVDTHKGGIIKIWNTKNGKLIKQFRDKGPCSLYTIACSPEGKQCVTGNSIIDVGSEEKIATLHGQTLKCPGSLSFSPDGSKIASGHRDGIQLWNSKDGSEIKCISTQRVTSVAFSSSGNRIVSTGVDKTIKIWDVDTGLEIMTLHGHEDMVFFAFFSLDGTKLFSSSRDRTVRVWELNNQKSD